MGKNLIQQARGKGGPTYRAPSFRYEGAIESPKMSDNVMNGQIIDLVHCSGHSSPLARVKYDDGEVILMNAPEGVKVGDAVQAGSSVETINPGNTMPLKNIPEGTSIYNIEAMPGDGGKFVRASGGAARVVARLGDRVIIKFPSGKQKEFNPGCRATIGIIAGGGRKEKPFLKAGKRWYAMRAKNKLWPQVQGISMNAVDHPFGGKCSHVKGRPTQSPRSAPPGRKVGKIAPRRTGMKR
jgi:large subunit ribosomal protein L2